MGSSVSSMDVGSVQNLRNIIWIGTSVSVSVAIIMNYLNNRDNKVVKWKKVGRVDQLFIYPLKSGKGVEVPSAQFNKLEIHSGMLRDRTFIIVNDSNSFLPVYQHPTAILLQVVEHCGQLYLRAPGKDDLRIREEDLGYSPEKEIQVKIQDIEVASISVGERYDRYLAEYFQNQTTGFRLVYHCHRSPSRPQRPKMLKYWPDMFLPDDIPTYNFTSTVSLMNLASLEDLNTRLEKEFKLERFRQNIIVKTDKGEAFEEDNWQGQLKIGPSVVLRFNKPCHRCLETTVDPDKGVNDAKSEPLRTLRKYRQLDGTVSAKEAHRRKGVGDSPLFGLNLSVDVEGMVNIGDEVYVEDLE